MMKVLLVTNRLGISGADLIALRLAEALPARGIEVEVATDGGELVDALEGAGIRVHRVPVDGKRPDRVLRATSALAALIAERGCDLVHVDAVTTAVAAAGASRLAAGLHRTRVPVLVTIHNLEHGWLYRPAGPILRCVADRVLAVADTERDRLVRCGLPAGLVETVPNGVEMTRFASRPGVAAAVRRALGLDPAATVVGTIARLSPEKGVDLFLEAAAIASRARRDLRFVVGGDGPERASLEARAACADLAGRVRFAGTVRDVPALLAALDVFVLASRREACPVVVLEAMAAGRPVVATAVGGQSGLVDAGRTGCLVPAGDGDRLAAAIGLVAADPEVRRRMGRCGRARVAARYRWASTVDRVVGAYRRLVGAAIQARETPTVEMIP